MKIVRYNNNIAHHNGAAIHRLLLLLFLAVTVVSVPSAFLHVHNNNDVVRASSARRQTSQSFSPTITTTTISKQTAGNGSGGMPFLHASAINPKASESDGGLTNPVGKRSSSSNSNRWFDGLSGGGGGGDDWIQHQLQTSVLSLALGWSVLLASTVGLWTVSPDASYAASDPKAIVGCLFQKCPAPLAKCILNPKCLANVVCINTCNGRPDEIECQIQCGDIFDNPTIGEFNKCAVSDMSCVQQQPDDGLYPVPSSTATVPKFNTNFFNGRLYITAGQNPLFDIFPCQVHFFTETEPGKFFGKLNWRVSEPDGEFFTRDALQEFYQDPKDPSHLINDNNEYLHYKDDWYIIDYEYDNNDKGLPPFAFVYYRGSNDAWDGYGGAVVYTRAAALPTELIPRLREAAKKVNFDFDKDFVLTDNSCPAELSAGEKVLLREKFAGNVVLQTEKQLQAAATKVRGNAVNSIKAQKIYFDNGFPSAETAFKTLEKNLLEFEDEIAKTVVPAIIKPIIGDTKSK